jgi:micrococcal nuclease
MKDMRALRKKQQAALLSIALACVWLGMNLFLGDEKDTVKVMQEGTEEEVQEEGAQTEVLRVVDGDTIRVLEEGTEEEQTIRIIGVNTPETVDSRSAVECFGKEASNALKERLTQGDKVRLIADTTQDDKDKYGRLLRYIEDDAGDIGLWLLAQGYANEYTYKIPYERQEEYQDAEQQAQDGERGLWNKEACP